LERVRGLGLLLTAFEDPVISLELEIIAPLK
jgi:hypothetical protein